MTENDLHADMAACAYRCDALNQNLMRAPAMTISKFSSGSDALT